MEALNIKDLSFRYDSKSVVFKNLSLSLEEGEYVSIIGHNGSGKSTLAKLIIGLIEPQTGIISIFGEELDCSKPNFYELKKKVGIVFQNPDNQFIGTTVQDDIAFGLENHCVPHEEMDAIIKEYATEVGMIDYLEKEPSSLSGGQKQRVAIAGVLAMKPDIIIMDESTAMLDPKGKREIRELTYKIRKINPRLTILSITHDIEEAFACDRVVVLNKGEIVYNDTPNNVFIHQKELEEMKRDVPVIYRLKDELIKQGIEVTSSTEEGMVNELCQ